MYRRSSECFSNILTTFPILSVLVVLMYASRMRLSKNASVNAPVVGRRMVPRELAQRRKEKSEVVGITNLMFVKYFSVWVYRFSLPSVPSETTTNFSSRPTSTRSRSLWRSPRPLDTRRASASPRTPRASPRRESRNLSPLSRRVDAEASPSPPSSSESGISRPAGDDTL